MSMCRQELLFWNDTHHLRKAHLLISSNTSGKACESMIGARKEKVFGQKNYTRTTEVKIARDHVNLICNTVDTVCLLKLAFPCMSFSITPTFPNSAKHPLVASSPERPS